MHSFNPITPCDYPSPVDVTDATFEDVVVRRSAEVPVLVDFWASWCGPCLKSFPWMNGLHAKHADDGLVILAVNVDQDRALADAFMKKTPAQFRVEYDAKGALATQFGVEAMPTSFLIGRDGKIHARHAGFRDKQREGRELEIERLLKESVP